MTHSTAVEDFDPFCRVFVNATVPFAEFCTWIASLAKGTARLNVVKSDLWRITIAENDDFDRAKASSGTDRWLHFPYMLEIEPAQGINLQQHITAIGQVLLSLWASGTDAVAACEFEDHLPANPGRADWNVSLTPNSPIESLAHLPVGSQHQANTNS